MKLLSRKLISMFLAAVIILTSLFGGAVTASAASSTVPILTIPISSVDSKAKDIRSIGQDLYLLSDNNNYKAIYRIGSAEIKKWRKTGKLKATK